MNTVDATADPLLIMTTRDLPTGELDHYDTDDADTFRSAKKKYGADWIWYDRPVRYRINRQGYRMAELDTIDWTNYMAVLGCSFTVGVGLPEECLFSTAIGHDIGLDVVNLARPGACNDLIAAQAVRLFEKKPAPRLVIVNWTSMSRRGYWTDGKMDLHGLGLKTNPIWKSSYQEYVSNQDQWPGIFLEQRRLVDALCRSSRTPVWHLTNFVGYEFDDAVDKIIYDLEEVGRMIDDVEYVNYNLARDIHLEGRWAHPGIGLQHRILERWKQIKGRYG